MVQAYQERGWDSYYILRFAPICNPPKPLTHTWKAGCMLWGTLDVHQVAGDIHIQTTTGLLDGNGRQIYDAEIVSRLKSSHVIEQ